jgi:basic membrane protein A
MLIINCVKPCKTKIPERKKMINSRSRGCRPLRISFVATLAVAALALTACGGSAPDSAEESTTSTEATESAAAESEATQEAGPRVGIFVDNAFGDGDFFDQAAAAEAQLVEQFNATVTTYEGQLQAQNFEPLLQDAGANNEIVFVLGFEAIDAMFKTVADNSQTTYVFIDADLGSPDVVSAQFRTAEGCFMAGALAATVNKSNGSSVAGFIGGVDAPVIKNCEVGYTQGVMAIDASQTVDPRYAGSFVDPAKGSEIAIAMQNAGAFAVFSYAGLTGAGVFDAAKSGTAVAPIGVVADKSNLAPGKSPGSLEMGVDAVIVETTGAFVEGSLEKGVLRSYSFDNGGWNMVYNADLVTADEQAVLQDMQAQIVSGEIIVK